ncbi:hypothetical protein BLS_010026 [Venturia inaequalis]|nr:hypothetical protein BLS_010026 [Venturia inaequalis]RDI82856.1 hypothetical protein Vi05172_g7061 [Venturia inaequalis]
MLGQVQSDAQKAGELGQALLYRHESYVADAENDRRRMLENLEILELEKRSVEERNAHTIEENRKLLDQLESLNAALAESDSRVLSLTECLRSAEAQIERLTGLAARTDLLNAELARFEVEQEALQKTLDITKEDERAAILRFQRAERTIACLQDQMDSIERDAQEERERHIEVVGRMERRRAVELELSTAAGRLKGAAASKTLPHDRNGNSVVSHFVKDILQDNANLQLGIVELKELLDRSNDEVEKLRQLMVQQGLQESPSMPSATAQNLGMELGTKELHVHHHYHAPSTTEQPKPARKEIARRPRKKRVSLTSSHFAPPSGTHTPRSSMSMGHSNHPITSSAILSQTSVTIPNQRASIKRWSVQSSQTAISSVPSSPYNESVFDRVFSDNTTELSRPTSPESNGAFSPQASDHIESRHDSIPRFLLDAGMRTSSDGAMPFSQQLIGASKSRGKSKRESAGAEIDPWLTGNYSIILEEENEEMQQMESRIETKEFNPNILMRPGLRRAASHESLISISGMDIHTLQSRPSQLLAGGGRRVLSSGSSQAALTGTSAVAIHASSRPSQHNSLSYLSSIAGSQQKSAGIQKKNSMGNLGSKVGWVFGRWGYAASETPPLSSTAEQTEPSEESNITGRSKTREARHSESTNASNATTPSLPSMDSAKSAPFNVKKHARLPGINQCGPIFGFGPEVPLPKEPIIKSLDVDALRESLGGE